MESILASIRIGMAVLLLALPWSAFAQVFKCVGTDGRVQYVQTIPKDGSCQPVKPPRAPGSGGSVEDLMKYSDEMDKSMAKESADRLTAEQEKTARETRCNYVRSRMFALEQSGGRVFTIDAKGERHYQTDEQYQQQLAATREAVARECGGVP